MFLYLCYIIVHTLKLLQEVTLSTVIF
jgi:hypothetical protein